MTLIQNRRVTTDNWLLLRPAEDGALPVVPAGGDVIVPLTLWLTQKDALASRFDRTGERVGVWLAGNEGPESIAANLDTLPVVALEFKTFGDGRAFSSARLLRERYGFKGEVRAFGQVIRDWLAFMERCGIDSFLLREDEDAENALAAFDELADASYQASVTEPLPLFRRRTA